MRKAFVLLRVSTSKQADEGESWELQELRARRFAEQHRIDIVQIYKEPYSGREIDRPVLNRKFADLERSRPKIDLVIIPDIDRFTRGGSYWYEYFKNRLLNCGVELIDVSGVIQPIRNTLESFGFEYDWSRVSPSRTSEALAAENAREEVTRILTRCIGQEIHLVNQGYWVRQAPIGYRNQRIEDAEGKKKTILREHPTEGIWIKTMFALREEGILDDEQICAKVNALGFQTRKSKRREKFTRKPIGTIGGHSLTPKILQKLICKPIYCGVVMEKWTRWQPLQAPWQGLVSIDMFNRANQGKIRIVADGENTLSVVFGKPIRRRFRENPLYPFRFVVRCPECRTSLKGSAPRGSKGQTYPTYHCARGHKYLGIPRKTLHRHVEAFAEKLGFKPEIIRLFEAVAVDEWHRHRHKALTLKRASGETVVELQKKQEHLATQFAHADSPVMRKLLEKQVEDLEAKIAQASDVRRQHEAEQEKLKAYLARIRYVMQRPGTLLLDTSHPLRLRQIWGLVFDELPTARDFEAGTPKLSVAFTLCGKTGLKKSQMAALLRSRWNLFWQQVERGGEFKLPDCSDS